MKKILLSLLFILVLAVSVNAENCMSFPYNDFHSFTVEYDTYPPGHSNAGKEWYKITHDKTRHSEVLDNIYGYMNEKRDYLHFSKVSEPLGYRGSNPCGRIHVFFRIGDQDGGVFVFSMENQNGTKINGSEERLFLF